MTTYNPALPTGLVNLDSDYQNVQSNFQQLDTSFAVDHTAFSQAAQNGYHHVIHSVPFSTTASNPPNNQPVSVPAAIPGFGQVFTAQINDGLNLDEALYFLSGGNRLTQLTRNLQPIISANGYTCLPGGLILQWGLVNGSHSGAFNAGDTGTVTFATANISFPVTCYTIWTNIAYTNTKPSTSGNAASVAVDSASFASGLSFNWYFDLAGSTNRYTKFYWVALGN
jgi:hypothetical protein